MTKWETCTISEVVVREKKVSSGLFSSNTIYICRLEACRNDTAGPQVIYKSDEYPSEESQAAYQKLLAHLSSEGWEPAGTNYGRVTLMKRPIIESVIVENDLTNLLQQLANLRNAGILTEEEFQIKKAEILKRI